MLERAEAARRATPADDPPRQGRLLGPRDRRGRASTAGRRRSSTDQGESDRNFERAHAAASIDAGRGQRRRSRRTTCARSPTPPPTRASAGRRRGPRVPGPARPRRRHAGTRSPRTGLPRAHLLPGRRPRRRAWPTSSAACSRTPPTTRSSPPRQRHRPRRAAGGPMSHVPQRTAARAAPQSVRDRLAGGARRRSTPQLPIAVPVIVGGDVVATPTFASVDPAIPTASSRRRPSRPKHDVGGAVTRSRSRRAAGGARRRRRARRDPLPRRR